MTWHFWNNDYSTTLLPLLIEFGFQSDMINVSRDFMKIWAKNDYSVSFVKFLTLIRVKAEIYI